MRNLFTILILTILVSCTGGVKGKDGTVFRTPVDYNDYIVARQRSLIEDLRHFGDMIDVDLDTAEASLKKSVVKTDHIIDDIRNMPAYKGDTIFRNAALKSFVFYKDIMTHEYQEILAFKRKGALATAEDQEKMNDIIARISKKEESLDRAFIRGQERFAEKNQMTLQEKKNLKEYREPRE